MRMLTSRSWPFRLATVAWLAVATGALPTPGRATDTAAPRVTGAVQVTTNPAPVRAHSSPQIARNPKTGELVVAEADVRGSRRCAVHISADGGRTWKTGGDPMVEPFTDCTIGAEWGTYFNVFFDDDGTLYLPFAANDPKVFATSALTGERSRKFVPRNLYLARSRDGGRTFDTSRVYEAPAGNPARGYAYGVMGAIDPEDSSRVYVTWAQGDFLSKTDKTKAVVAASTDGGRTFGAPVDMTDERGSEQAWLAVGRGGVLHAAWWSLAFDSGMTIFERGPDDEPLPLIYGRSADGGQTWTHEDIDPGNQEYTRNPVLAADPGSDMLYVLWFGNADSRNLPLKFVDKDVADVFLKASSDAGRTWGPRRAVNDDAGKGQNHAHPSLSIAPGGRVDIAWYDNRLNPRQPVNVGDDTGLQDVFYTSSTDSGATFATNVRISDRSIDRSVGVWSNNIGSAAPIGIFSTRDTVHFAWQDSRNGRTDTQAEDTYFASLELDGSRSGRRRTSAVPSWAALGAGTAIGLGVGMVAFSVWNRRRSVVTLGRESWPPTPGEVGRAR